MIPSVPFLDLTTEIVSEVAEGVDYLDKLDSVPGTIFVAPQVDIKLMCFIKGGGRQPLEIIPSNAVSSNYYDTTKYESVINIRLRRIPGEAHNVKQ
jgi:hypothetical protein